MTGLVPESPGNTPLTGAELHGLRLPLLTRSELNLAEAENISHAMSWLFSSRRRLKPESVTTEAWVKNLHRRMYNEVWAWAGHYRTADRNLGVPRPTPRCTSSCAGSSPTLLLLRILDAVDVATRTAMTWHD